MKCYMTGKPCDFHKRRREVDKKRVFLITPFGFPYDSLYQENGEIQRFMTRKMRLKARTSDHAIRLGSIMCHGICKEIVESAYVLADVSAPNPNVYYELGLAYSLGKKILACANRDAEDDHIRLFEEAWRSKKGGALRKQTRVFIRYSDVSSLKERLENCLPKKWPSRTACPENDKQILILENGYGAMGGLYERIISRALKGATFAPEKNSLTKSERASFDDAAWRKWECRSVSVRADIQLKELADLVRACKICVVDTTVYKHRNVTGDNPYMYFCLGLAHGMEKEVVPITNNMESASPPFDVKGLWHINFQEERSFKDQFGRILANISVDFHRQRQKAPYKRIWDPLLSSDNQVSIFFYGRPAKGRSSRRQRTGIDSWDTRAVSEASFYLAQTYPTAVIKAAPPRTKSPTPMDEIIKSIEDDLRRTRAACVIVGAPDNNDHAELVLSGIYRNEPFKRRKRLRKSKGFIFHKTNLPKSIKSSFYIKDDSDFVEFPDGTYKCTKKATYGVLTIARNPYTDKGGVVVLSGFTGIATCGLMKLLIESEPERDDHDLVKNLNECMKEEIAAEYDTSLRKPFTALVKFYFNTSDDPYIDGDNRLLKKIKVVSVIR